ncbi:MAG: argininosuccinate lyase [Chloroflexota bacterium]
MGAVENICREIAALQLALMDSAEQYLSQPMPGYTHLQHAQPITWGHWALSHVWPLVRDVERFRQASNRAAVLPLGAAALAGSAFPVDRRALADRLGFNAVAPNSLDAVSDRDFAADFLYAATLTAIHLSRLSEHLIIFSSAEFGFVEVDDAYATGSSIMPQKKNPDTLELTRGKSGRLIGNLTGLLATLKGLPSSYDKDLQEDKKPVFDAYDTLSMALPVMAGLVQTLAIRPERMAGQLEGGLLATELADYLVRQGVPFREAHHLVGQAVRRAEELGVELTDLTDGDLQAVDGRFGDDVAAVLSVEAALDARSLTGGTAPTAIREQLATARQAVQNQ